MIEKPPVAVTRGLTYAWVECSNPSDAQAFAAQVEARGWQNIVRYLPRKKDAAGGVHFEDSSHPLLPIRWSGRARLILPNSVVDTKRDPKPYVNDELFNAFRAAHGVGPHRPAKGPNAFDLAVEDYNEFLARWAFAPGVVSGSKLTTDSDATHYADLVVLSGHGGGGAIWGGDSDLQISLNCGPTHSDRLKYMLVPTCFNLWEDSFEDWVDCLTRTHPLHGVLGYKSSYTGAAGRVVMGRFAENLHKDGGTMPILDAFREAHAGYGEKDADWAAFQHKGNRGDTLRDWIAGNLRAPSGNEIFYYHEGNWPNGEKVEVLVHPHTVRFYMGETRIDSSNRYDADVGLFPGERGHLELTATPSVDELVSDMMGGTLRDSAAFKILFYRFRAQHELDLRKLLQFEETDDASVEILENENVVNQTANADAILVRPRRPGLSTIRIPFRVHPEAHRHYDSTGADAHGDFWTQLTCTCHAKNSNDVDFDGDGEVDLSWSPRYSARQHSAVLRGPR